MLDVESLDGNGQLFLALQDISMPNFISKLDGAQNLKKNQDRKRVLVIFTDEEWDINQLRDGFAENPNDNSSYTTREAVTKRVHEVGKY